MDFGKVEETQFFVLYAFYVADYMTNLTSVVISPGKIFSGPRTDLRPENPNPICINNNCCR